MCPREVQLIFYKLHCTKSPTHVPLSFFFKIISVVPASLSFLLLCVTARLDPMVTGLPEPSLSARYPAGNCYHRSLRVVLVRILRHCCPDNDLSVFVICTHMTILVCIVRRCHSHTQRVGCRLAP